MALNGIYDFINNLQAFNIQEETIRIMNDNAELLQNLLKRQLGRGKDGRGENVTVFGRDYYADSTIQDKRYNGIGLGKETEYITNYMHGTFYQSIKLKVQGEKFLFDSSVDYFTEILRRSGSVIMELDDENLSYFATNILKPQLEIRFNQIVNGL